MNKVIIDSLAQLPGGVDLTTGAKFINCSVEDAIMTFREYFGADPDTVYTFSRKSGKLVHHLTFAEETALHDTLAPS